SGVTAPNLPTGWTSSPSGAAAVDWATSASNSDSTPNNAFVPNPGDITDSRLTSPVIAATQANLQLKFRNNYDSEPTYDGGVLEISIDGGPFSDIVSAGGGFKAGGYTGPIDSGFQNPLA